MISVVVNSLNEAKKLSKCLTSVQNFADEIIVIDMHSSDETVQVAKRFNAKMISHEPLEYVEPVRSFAVDKAKGPWVLILDPDEQITDKLKDQLKQVAQENFYVGVNIPRRHFMFGKKIKHTNFWPDRQLRFIKKGKVVFSTMIHSYPQAEGKILDLAARDDLAIQHYSYKTYREYWDRMKRYSNIEAKNLYESGRRFSLFNLFYKPLYDFVRRYIRHLGFMDGWNGLVLSLFQFYYYIVVELKLLKLQLTTK